MFELAVVLLLVWVVVNFLAPAELFNAGQYRMKLTDGALNVSLVEAWDGDKLWGYEVRQVPVDR